MLLNRTYQCLLLLFLLPGFAAPAQEVSGPGTATAPESFYTVGKISITGNTKTRDAIILRELKFQEGDRFSPAEMAARMEEGRQQLMNTALFHHVLVAAKDFDGNRINVAVEVKERWYLFPVPYFKPVDRNINQWLFEQKASFDRVNYGAKLTWNNATGRNDKFRLWMISGYTRQLSFSYDRLYIDRNMKLGANFSFATGKNREINYNTVNDKQVFLKDPDNYVRHFVNGHFALSYRPAINTRHSFGIGFTSEEVEDTIVTLNPVYFKQGRNRIQYPSIFYNLTWFNLDYIPYPSKGYAARFTLSKNGLNSSINLWQMHLNALANWTITPKTFVQVNMYSGIKLPFRQPWFNKRFLGYGDNYMQGYEYNVIDGVAGGYIKTSLNRQLWEQRIRLPRGRGKETVVVPFRVYGKLYGNSGYVHNPDPGENGLSNKMLYTGGVGIDIVTLYDVVLKLEWSFNQLGQNGLFLHRKSIF